MKKTLTTLFFIGFMSICFAQKPLVWYNHTQLNVKNLDTSVAFYTKVFGFDTIPCPFPNTEKKIVKWLNVGENCQIHIIENVGDTTHIVFDGHLGVNVRSLQEIKERLLKYNYGYQTGKLKIISEGKMPYGAKTASLQDPDGHLIHVIEDAQLSFNQNADETIIRQLDALEAVSFLKNDTATLANKLWSKDFVVTNPFNNIVTVKDIFALMRTQKITQIPYTRTIEKITIANNIAFVMGVEIPNVSKAAAGVPKNVMSPRRFTNVWVKTVEGWRLAGRQATNIN